jgi:hypothetical protein
MISELNFMDFLIHAISVPALPCSPGNCSSLCYFPVTKSMLGNMKFLSCCSLTNKKIRELKQSIEQIDFLN